MIEVKRSCNSSIREDQDHEKITFGAFTIRFTDEEYHIFEAFMDMTEQPPAEALEDFLLSALEHFKTAVLEPKVVY